MSCGRGPLTLYCLGAPVCCESLTPLAQPQPHALLSGWNMKGRPALFPVCPAALPCNKQPWRAPLPPLCLASHGPASPTRAGPASLTVQSPPQPEAQAGLCGLPACHCSPPGFGSCLSFCWDSHQLLITDFPTLLRFWLRHHFFLQDVFLCSSF